jgi:hypothetical protein
MKTGLFFCLTLVVFGLLDLVTTVLGLTCFGAVEANPLLSGIAMASPMIFSAIKLFAIVAVGFTFYKAGNMVGVGQNGRFIQLSYASSLVFMTYVVTNNFLVVAHLS